MDELDIPVEDPAEELPLDQDVAKKLELLKMQQAVQQPLPPVADLIVPKDLGPSPAQTDQLRAAGIEGLKAGFAHAAATGQPVQPPVAPEPLELPPGVANMGAPIRPEGLTPEASPSRDVAVRAAKAGIPAEGMALLDTIATREAEPAFQGGKRAGWNTMVGGAQFDPNTMEHPHKAYPHMKGFVGGAGRSYASGRYQETTATYYENVARSQKLHPGMEVRGWSEEAQNVRNWDKAQEVYARHVRRNPSEGLSGDLLKDLAANKDNPAAVGRMSRALSAEWTSAPGGREGSKITGGKESYYGNTFVKMLQNAVAQAGGSREDLNEFMNPTLTALQKPGLEKGSMETPGERAQVMALSQGTPIEKIKAVAERVRAAGPIGDRSGQTTVPARRAATSRVTHTDMPQEVLPGQAPLERTMPIPGMDTGDFSMTTEATNPSMFSTIRAYQDQNRPVETAPEVKAPSDIQAEKAEAETKSFLQNAMKAAQYLVPLSQGPIGAPSLAVRAVTDALKGTGPELPSAEQIAGFVQGAGAGIASIPTNTYYGMKSFGQAAGGIFLDQPEWQGYSLENAQRMMDWQNTMRSAVGIDPNNRPPGAAAGEFVGSNLSPNIVKTGINLLTGAGMEYANPLIAKWAESKPLGPIIPSAHAASVFGKPPIIVNTPGGPVAANDASPQGIVIGGLGALGFGLGISQSSRIVRYARENPILASRTDPTRQVPGSATIGGVTASSLPVDVFKASTVNPMQSVMDSLDRGKRYLQRVTHTGKVTGINKDAANEVYQTMRIQTRSGAENRAGQALINGEMKTDQFHFQLPKDVAPIAKLHEFAEKNREFPEYLRLRAIQDEIQFNRGYNAGRPNAAQSRLIPPRIPRPETFNDHQNNHWNHRTAAHAVIAMDAANPEFRKMYGDYQANLAETRRFSSDGQHAPENPTDLAVKALSQPTLPIFSSTQQTKNMFDRVLNGDSPLRLAEDNMKKAIMRAMSHDADQRYVNFSRAEIPTSFKEVTPEWVRDRGQVARAQGAILRRKENGEYKYWVGDPFVVSVLNNDSAPVATLGKVVVGAKRLFEQTTTGKYAPWFPLTSVPRTMGQGIVTAPPISSTGRFGRPIGPAGPISAAVGFAANITPRAMKSVAPTVKWFEDAIMSTPLGQMLDPKYHNLMSRAMHDAYNKSFYNRMLLAGAYGPDALNTLTTDSAAHITRLKTQVRNPHMRAILDTLQHSQSMWAKFLRAGAGTVTKPLKAFNTTKEAFNESVQFGWAYKAHGMGGGAKKGGRLLSDAEVAEMMRDYTGDPMVKGNPWTRGEGGSKQLLRFTGTPGQEARAKGYAGTGVTMQGWRAITPWAGVLVQSPASTLAALRDNPVRANLAMTTAAVVPELIAYMWNMAHGQKALSYALDERGEHRNTHSVYFFNPEFPDQPWKGWEIPMPQEFIFTRAMTRSFANQFMGRASDTIKTELWDALKSFYFGGVQPPIPPPAAALLGLSGIATPEGYFNMRQQREHAFAGPGKENRIELMWRNIMPSISDISLAAMTAGWESEGSDWKDFSVKDAAKGAVYRTQTRVPIIGGPGRLPASSAKTDQLFNYQRQIDDLNARYNKWDKAAGAIDPNKGRGVSAGGIAKTKAFVGQQPPAEGKGGTIPIEGIVPPSNNKLYNLFMKEMANTYNQDSPDKGGIGFKALWKNHDIYKKKLDALNVTHAGTEAQYVKNMQEKWPKTRAYLEKNGIDPLNYREVRDFYSNRVVQAQLRILQTIQATEQKFNKDPRIRKLLKPGQEFKLDLLDPNSSGP